MKKQLRFVQINTINEKIPTQHFGNIEKLTIFGLDDEGQVWQSQDKGWSKLKMNALPEDIEEK